MNHGRSKVRIVGVEIAIHEINGERLRSNQKRILRKDLASFLSKASRTEVKLYWVRLALRNKPLSVHAANELLKSLDIVCREYGIPSNVKIVEDGNGTDDTGPRRY